MFFLRIKPSSSRTETSFLGVLLRLNYTQFYFSVDFQQTRTLKFAISM